MNHPRRILTSEKQGLLIVDCSIFLSIDGLSPSRKGGSVRESESGIAGGTKAAEADHGHAVKKRQEPCLTGSVNRASKALKEAVASYYTNFRAVR